MSQSLSVGSVGELRARVGQALYLAGTAHASDADSLLDELGRPDNLRTLLHVVSAEREGLARVAAGSYRHVLGFDKIVLVNSGDRGQLRIHIWWPGEQRTPEHIHDHRASFSSRVVYGRLTSEVFERSPDGDDFVEFRELSLSADNRWRFERCRATRLKSTIWMDIPVGSRYGLAADVLHRIDVHEDASAASLFLQCQAVRNWSSVFVEPRKPVPTGRAQSRFTVTEVADRLSRLSSML